MQKKGFTLIEILIVIFVISMGLILIIRGMSETHRYISETGQKTIALNLAKEGIEAVYNLRNSNWRKWSDKKDECWLNVDEGKCEDTSQKLTNNQMRILGMNKNTNHWISPSNTSDITKWERDDNEARFKQTPIRKSPDFQLLYHQ
jgi:prepilin-type cleavage/methylation N-terminal domain protein